MTCSRTSPKTRERAVAEETVEVDPTSELFLFAFVDKGEMPIIFRGSDT
jgi:hypothetical protein